MAVSVSPYNPSWPAMFQAEAQAIKAGVDLPLRLHHIGSTSVPGLIAKPIIDILGEISDLPLLDTVALQFESLGYEVMGAFGIEGRRYYRKVICGTRTHHLHIFETQSPHIARHLHFRDYLIAHPEVAAAYGALKVKLTENARHWDGYMDGKDAFVKRTEADAIQWASGPR